MSEDKRKKVMVCILNQGTTSAGMETQLIQWQMDMRDQYSFAFFPARYAFRPIANNRNRIVKDFLNSDQDYLIMIDDDNPPVQNIFELLKYEKDVISVPTPGRDDNGVHIHTYMFGKNHSKDNIDFVQVPPEKRKGLVKIDAAGTCCIIIKREVLEKVKKPFEDLYDEEGILITNDDLAFCLKCKDAGFEIWTHYDYVCSHYKTVDLLQMSAFIYRARTDGMKQSKGVDIKKISLKELQEAGFLNNKLPN